MELPKTREYNIPNAKTVFAPRYGDGDIENKNDLVNEGLLSKYAQIHNVYNEKLAEIKGRPYTGRLINGVDFLLSGSKDSILAYPFDNMFELIVFVLVNRLKPSGKFTFFSRNMFCVDATIRYLKYVSLDYSAENIHVYHYVINPTNDNLIAKRNADALIFFEKNEIKYDKIDLQMTPNIINRFAYNTNSDFIMVDIILKKRYERVRDDPCPYNAYIPFLIVALRLLKKGGTLLLNASGIQNYVHADLLIFIRTCFEYATIPDLNSDATGPAMFTFAIFRNFQGNAGHIIAALMQIVENSEGQSNSKKTLHNIVDVTKTQEVLDFYRSVKKLNNRIIIKNINMFANSYVRLVNINNSSYTKGHTDIDRQNAIIFANENNMTVKEWLNREVEFYNDTIKNFIDMKSLYMHKIQNAPIVKINISNKIINPRSETMRQIRVTFEATYMYIDSVNYEKYKEIELLVNSIQKKINKILFNHGININGKVVSRAWLKFYEMANDVKLFDEYASQKKITALHTCEAPGNFINAAMYYIKKFFPNTTYDWIAQSLSADMADFYDSYGFIKKTSDRWDMGPIGTGDILDKKNFDHYTKKYKVIDIFISDCGEKWGPFQDNKYMNIRFFQLLYAFYVPREGGAFVLKTFAGISDKLYLAMMQILSSVYKEMYIFRSSENIWSVETYIIGKHKLPIPDDILSYVDFLCSSIFGHTAIRYPFDRLDTRPLDSFIDAYQDILSTSSYVRKFFALAASEHQIHDSNKHKLIKAFDNRNKQWLSKYFPDLQY